MTSSRSGKSCTVLALLAVPSAVVGVDPANASTIVVYHVNPANYSGVTNMDTGDAGAQLSHALRPRTTPSLH